MAPQEIGAAATQPTALCWLSQHITTVAANAANLHHSYVVKQVSTQIHSYVEVLY
jgi:hypothetical protein